MTQVRVKICGLREPRHLAAAAAAGAAYGGMVFFGKSPRNLHLYEAKALALAAPPGMAKVALTVDADNDTLDAITRSVPFDMLQLHGAESPERVAEVKARYGLPVMKAVGVREVADLKAVETYGAVADQLLIDAKPAEDAELPGGNGLAFDWRLLQGVEWPVPWMLAGGLDKANVAEAIRLTGARQVDVSSGVETAPGQKDVGLIRGFMKAAAG